ncbi:uncharacterized protein LOC110726646 [Chenopodium quinoa]|uniref:uncharacterized protein LOC110726646 n=1 Tax=Chenopodium quinoa TaxID=63459 RepID=UPI000B77AAE4|nr:uncharacterized protein LOC110726646 [Chenopodium quinoa]
MEKRGAVVDYSKLLDELLIRIVENHIVSVIDFINFSCVCHSWRRAANACDIAKLRTKWPRHQMPWLMLTDGIDGPEVQSKIREATSCPSDKACSIIISNRELGLYYSSIDPLCCQRSLLNMSWNRNMSYDFNIPEMHGRACWGSPYGWVVTLGVDREMYLFNPFTRSRLPLPSQSTFHRDSDSDRDSGYVEIYGPVLSRVVLLRVPSKYRGVDIDARVCDNYDNDDDVIWLVVVIYTLPMQDVFYCHQMRSLIFVDGKANLFYSDLHDPEHPQQIQPYLAGPPITEQIGDKYKCFTLYIIESNGNILIVNKKTLMGETCMYHTCNFSVYKLDESTKSWEEVNDLQGVSLFLGLNVSMSINAKDAGCRSNCIYFCDDLRAFYYGTKISYVGGHDMGVYSMDDGTIQPLYTGHHSRSSHCCPFWLSPML